MNAKEIQIRLTKNNPHFEYVSGYQAMLKPARFRLKGTSIEFEAYAHTVINGVSSVPRSLRSELQKLEPHERRELLKKLGDVRTK
jgi:hypothetical protein